MFMLGNTDCKKCDTMTLNGFFSNGGGVKKYFLILFIVFYSINGCAPNTKALDSDPNALGIESSRAEALEILKHLNDQFLQGTDHGSPEKIDCSLNIKDEFVEVKWGLQKKKISMKSFRNHSEHGLITAQFDIVVQLAISYKKQENNLTVSGFEVIPPNPRATTIFHCYL
jgi:hypothetical protein